MFVSNRDDFVPYEGNKKSLSVITKKRSPKALKKNKILNEVMNKFSN